MNSIQLYINDQLVDLGDNTPIALTYQINNLADVKNQQGNTSNQFKLPLTQRNRRILGFPDDVAFCSNSPYGQYPAKLVQDGLEIIPFGIIELNNIDQDNASVTILSGNVDFFDAIDGKLYDMGDSTSVWSNYGKNMVWQPFEHNWTLSNVVNSQTSTDGWIWPVVDYGLIQTDFTSQPLTIDVRYLRPGFFLKTAIGLLANLAGYTINPDSYLLKNPLYHSLIVQFANDNFQHGADYQNRVNSRSAILGTDQNQDINPGGNGPDSGVINFTASQQASQQLTQNGRYVAGDTLTLGIELNYGLQVTDTTATGGSTPYLEVRIMKYSGSTSTLIASQPHYANNKASSGIGGIGHHDGAPTIHTKQKLNADAVLNAGESIGVEYQLWPGYKRIKGTFYEGAILNVVNKQTDVVYDQPVQCERIFPDISMKDLLKDTLQHFGIICQTDNASRTITFASFADIAGNIAIAKDWSRKCLDQGKAINFQLGGYARVNYMQYKADDNVMPADFANAQVVVADNTLPAAATLFESQFAPTLNRPYIGGTIASINKVDTSADAQNTDFSISTQPRLLIDQKYDLRQIGKEINFTDGVNSTVVNGIISTPYFYKTDGDFSLRWDDLRKLYYPNLEKILYQTKKVVRYFLLTPRDILELDLLIPVYLAQDSCYYYVNKIDAWQKGQPTKVELIKLG